jgi:beta-glucosidase
VLLKNDNHVLPLNTNMLNKIAVIGPNANVADILLGNYAGNPTEIITILQGIQRKMLGKQVTYAGGCAEQWCTDMSMFPQAIDAAKSADTIILVMGIRSCPYDNQCWIGRAEIEGEQKDRVSLNLPGYQPDLIRAIRSAAGQKPIVLVLVNGSPLTFDTSPVNAILEAFYPGEQGGLAVADALFGDYNPGGKLPITFVKSVNDLPDFTSMVMDNRTYRYYTGSPMYPFGFGLSYTTFQYSNLLLSASTIVPCQPIIVQVTVTNSGTVTGDEVVQVYFSLVNRSVPTPKVQLVALQQH